MIGRALRLEIERYATSARGTNALYLRAREGALSARHLLAYLANIQFLVAHTPIYLLKAADRARALEHFALAAHYEQKIVEEAGHEAWAASDLRDLSTRSGLIAPAAGAGIVPAMRGLVGYLAELIERDPSLYLAYILFAEHLTVLVGPEWLTLLEERCGIPRSAMTVVGNHAELDKSHVEHALEEIDDLVGDPRKLPAMREALRTSMRFFDAFCTQVTRREESDEPLRTTERATRAISAA